MSPQTLFNLIPRFLVISYLNLKRERLMQVGQDLSKASSLLEDVEAGYEYLDGYRAHLQRKIREWDEEYFELMQNISVLENLLYPSE